MLEPSYGTATIQNLTISATLPGSADEILHWQLMAEVDGATVSFNMRPARHSRPQGELVVSTQWDALPPEAADKRCTLAVQDSHKIKNLLEFIQSNHFDYYSFTDEGHGSRHWVTRVVHALEVDGMVKQGSVEGLLAFFDRFGVEHPGVIVEPTPEGSFGQARWMH